MRQWNQKNNNNNKEGFYFFQKTRKNFWNVVNTNWLPRRKLHLSQEKSVRRKTLDIQDQNAVNDSVKSQYNFNKSMCSVHQAVKKYIHLTISLFTRQCITIALQNISCRMFLRILLRKGNFCVRKFILLTVCYSLRVEMCQHFHLFC